MSSEDVSNRWGLSVATMRTSSQRPPWWVISFLVSACGSSDTVDTSADGYTDRFHVDDHHASGNGGAIVNEWVGSPSIRPPCRSAPRRSLRRPGRRRPLCMRRRQPERARGVRGRPVDRRGRRHVGRRGQDRGARRGQLADGPVRRDGVGRGRTIQSNGGRSVRSPASPDRRRRSGVRLRPQPDTIGEHDLSIELPVSPSIAATPSCL